MIQFKPDPSDLQRLKEPFGKLISGTPRTTMPQLKRLLASTRPLRVSAVGDVVSRETHANGIPADLRIIDHISMRKPTASFNLNAGQTYRVLNPAGVITEEAWNAIRRAMQERNVLLLVDGEEDLLTLPCIVESPHNSVVLYGQPNQGLVVVDTTPAAKNEAHLILGRMTREETV